MGQRARAIAAGKGWIRVWRARVIEYMMNKCYWCMELVCCAGEGHVLINKCISQQCVDILTRQPDLSFPAFRI